MTNTYGFIAFMTPTEREHALVHTLDADYRFALKVALTEERWVTLDGEPAQVCGYNLRFPVVRSAKTSAEFAWETVARVVAAGGAFES